jgi:hypothetical protein
MPCRRCTAYVGQGFVEVKFVSGQGKIELLVPSGSRRLLGDPAAAGRPGGVLR